MSERPLVTLLSIRDLNQAQDIRSISTILSQTRVKEFRQGQRPRQGPVHEALKQGLRTVVKVAGSFEGDIDGDGGIEHGGGLAEAALPGHVVRQLPQGISHAAQIDAAVALPRSPRHLSIRSAQSPSPRPQSVRVRLRASHQY